MANGGSGKLPKPANPRVTLPKMPKPPAQPPMRGVAGVPTPNRIVRGAARVPRA